MPKRELESLREILSLKLRESTTKVCNLINEFNDKRISWDKREGSQLHYQVFLQQ